ncbi:alpha/beta hydrolase [Massilia cavernae]|uniref:Alpha/beta hydrolase n=1 Tax=Massilia cavernae TaxID=2320864 RepID=A0A418XGM6_9BURK|nr:alpha/beta hydrolase [Massilia cavernae]RJG11623.1 alpha/beta hydrolase [Massilia cavernae]
MQTDLRQALARLGREISPQLITSTAALLAPHAPRPHVDSCTVFRDLGYGPHARHRMDVFVPAGEVQVRPVLLFVHGGGFTMGSKGGPDDVFYNHIGAWAVAQGWVAATMNYRLAPDHVWPSGADDVALATQWLQENAHAWTVGAPAVVLMGHSAGAAHVAGCLARWPSEQQPRPSGAILLSGLYDLLTLQHSERERLYFGTDEGLFAERSTLSALLQGDWACLYTVSELDPAEFQQQAARVVAAAMEQTGRWPEMVYLSGHNHLSNVQQLGSLDDTVGPLLAEFVRRVTDQAG